MAKAEVTTSGTLFVPDGELSPSEKKTRVWYEEKINKGLDDMEGGFQSIVKSLHEIETLNLYRPYKSMHAYIDACIPRLAEFSRRYKNFYIKGGEVVHDIEAQTGGNIALPSKESHTRALAPVPRDRRGEIWEKVQNETKGEASVKAINEVAHREIPGLAKTAYDNPYKKWPKATDLSYDYHRKTLFFTVVQPAILSRNLPERRIKMVSIAGYELEQLFSKARADFALPTLDDFDDEVDDDEEEETVGRFWKGDEEDPFDCLYEP